MQRFPHPVHAVLLAGTVPLFLGVLLSDLAYTQTYEVQWKNFASWLLVGGLVFSGLALLWALIELPRVARTRIDRTRAGGNGPRAALYPALLAILWVLGFINALVHAGDAWASVPTGPILSTLVALLAITATGLGFYNLRSRAAQ